MRCLWGREKDAIASKKINKDEKITKDNIAFKRADEGIYPDESRFIIGRTASQDIKENDPITWNKILNES